jgi:hypothetical protein
MITKAFNENRIKPAFPTVPIAGDKGGDVAAAAQQALARHNETIAAAASD